MCQAAIQNMITEQLISHLPDAVRRWLKRSNVIGKEIISSVHLKQRGKMRTKPDGRWLAVQAEQYNTIDPPSFLWLADVRVAPLIHLSGKDTYKNGKGHMLIRLFNLIPVTNASGPEIDQGALLRYLAEIVWFPTAALASYIQWKEIDSLTAEATMTYGEVTASAQFSFNAEGDFESLSARRYYDRKTGATLEHWHIHNEQSSYKTFQGFRIPVKSVVTWKLKEGDFTWYHVEITHAEYAGK